jgi:hypothetical protein
MEVRVGGNSSANHEGVWLESGLVQTVSSIVDVKTPQQFPYSFTAYFDVSHGLVWTLPFEWYIAGVFPSVDCV